MHKLSPACWSVPDLAPSRTGTSRKSRRYMSLPFTKMHGAGNDFVLLDGRDGVLGDLGDVARAIGDRHMGVGSTKC